MIVWILLGSLSLNLLYIKRDRERSKVNITAYARGLLFGIVLGPLTIPVSMLIDKYMKE